MAAAVMIVELRGFSEGRDWAFSSGVGSGKRITGPSRKELKKRGISLVFPS